MNYYLFALISILIGFILIYYSSVYLFNYFNLSIFYLLNIPMLLYSY